MGANVKNLQSALKWLKRRIREEVKSDGYTSVDHAAELEFIEHMLKKFPLRNCEVGTAEEQGERQKAYCRKHFTPDKFGGNCHKCPLKDRRGWSCQLAWAQMPYEAKEGSAK